jgi:drug/metabolite transporter (DMT)-like permease
MSEDGEKSNVLKGNYFNHIYILGTIIFTVYGQIIMKWRIGMYGVLPADIKEKIFFLFQLLLDPFILSGLFSAFVASLFWMMAMTKFDMSYAYPFIGATFVLNLSFAVMLLHEPFAWNKAIGSMVIILGIFIASRAV